MIDNLMRANVLRITEIRSEIREEERVSRKMNGCSWREAEHSESESPSVLFALFIIDMQMSL